MVEKPEIGELVGGTGDQTEPQGAQKGAEQKESEPIIYETSQAQSKTHYKLT